MFLNYDLLARRWVRYGKIYPFGEAFAGILMVAGALTWLSAPVALFIGTVGAVSVFKAVYIDKRELKCACVGGDSKCSAWLCLAHGKSDDDGHGDLDADQSLSDRLKGGCRFHILQTRSPDRSAGQAALRKKVRLNGPDNRSIHGPGRACSGRRSGR